VKEVVCHVVGITTDVLSGNLDGVGSNAWTQAQVDARRDLPIDEVVAEWTGNAKALDDGMRAAGPGMSSLLIGDLASHDFDVRGALGNSDGRDSDATFIALQRYATGGAGSIGDRITQGGLPALQLDVDGEVIVAGEGAPGATVRANAFSLLRSLTGRRSADQVRALDWDGDPTPYVPIFTPYPMRDTPLNE
jgi:hypothetical protein